jgi:hypothetical protein
MTRLHTVDTKGQQHFTDYEQLYQQIALPLSAVLLYDGDFF